MGFEPTTITLAT